MDVISISNLKLQKPLSSISQLQNFLSTPRIVLRNPYTPKTLLFKKFSFTQATQMEPDLAKML
jgi:hypothetical protein